MFAPLEARDVVRFGMARSREASEHCVVVVRNAPVTEVMAVAVVLDDYIARPEIGRNGIAHAAEIDGALLAHASIRCAVSVPTADHVCVGAGEQGGKITFGNVGRDAGAVVRAHRCVDSQQVGPVTEHES